MITMDTDRLVDDYLRRLESAAAHLQRSRRAELVSEIREHIETALREEDAAGEAAVRNVLERLGPPEEIVEAAEPPPGESAARTGKLEIAALIALVVPVIGWLFGIVLVLVSEAWSRRDKAVGITLALAGVLLPFLSFAVGSESAGVSPVLVDGSPAGLPEAGGGDSTSVVEIVALFVIVFAGLPSALYLGWRLRRHPSA